MAKYVKLVVGNNVVAVTNDNCILVSYMTQRKIKIFTLDKLPKSRLLEYEDLILVEFNGFVMTNKDIKVFNMLKEESRIVYDDGIRLINEIIKCGKMKEKDERIMKRSVDIIKKYGAKNILGNEKSDIDTIFSIINMREDEKDMVIRNY